jgi:thiol-disulfide isomerase/thioredoxin
MRSTRVRIIPLAAALVLALAACGGGTADGTDDAAPTVSVGGGEPAESADGGAEDAAEDAAADAPAQSGSPAGVTFEAAKLGGGELSSASLAGKDTVLWFWAPWCTVCRAEAPNVTAAAAAFEGEVEVIGVAGRGEVSEMEDFVSDTDTGSLTHIVDDSGAIWSGYGVAAQPSFAFIDDEGNVEVHVGALGEAGLTDRLDALTAA